MPVSIARLRQLIDLAASQGVDGLDMIEDGTHIRISRSGDAPVIPAMRAGPAADHASPSTPVAPADTVAAPMFGVFHITPAPGAAPYAAPGDTVASGQQLCLIEAMKMFHPVLSDRAGKVAAILAEPGAEVARGQPLFRIVAA